MYNRGMARRLALALISALVLTGCESREVEKDLKIVEVRTGWYDAGLQSDGNNKLVPSVSLALQNVSDREIASVQLNAAFRRGGDSDNWGEHFIRAIGTDGLAPGSVTGSLVMRSSVGYTGTQPRLQLLQNKEFVDARVVVLGKHGSRAWVEMGEFQIDRQLLTE
jgi:hypothetical protein